MACRKDGKGRVLRKGEGYRKGDGTHPRRRADFCHPERQCYACGPCAGGLPAGLACPAGLREV